MTHRRRRAARLTAGALTVAAVAVSLTACSNDADSAGDDKAATTSSPATESPAQETGGDDTSATGTADQSTPEGTVAAWVAAVVKGETEQACLLMGEAATGSSPATTGSAETCAADSAQGKQIQQSVGQFTESFTPDPPTDDPQVAATKPADATAEKAVFSADRVTIDGKTLEEVIVANSTGVESGQLDVKLETSKLDGAWYVTNMDFDIG